MAGWLGSMACAMAMISALALYASSPHCMWSALRRQPRVARLSGIALALLSLATWIAAAGIAVGVCAMLASWMLGLMLQPYLTLLTGTPSADATATEKN